MSTDEPPSRPGPERRHADAANASPSGLAVRPARGLERVSVAMRSLTGSVLIVVAIILLATLAVMGAVLFSIDQVDGARVARAKADRVMQLSDQVEQSVLNMETGLRGYWLTHERSFLAPWYQGRRAFRRELPVLRRLVIQDAGAHARASAVVAAIGRQGSSYISAYAPPLIRHPPSGPGRDRTLRDGKQRVDSLRSLFERLNTVTDHSASRSLTRAASALERTRLLAVGGLSFILLLAALAGAYLVRAVSRPIRSIALSAAELSSGELASRAKEQGPSEVRGLARSFNAMAAAIERGIETMAAQNASLAAARDEAQRYAHELDLQQELAIDMIATLGFDGYFKRLNPAWERTLGWSQTELLPRPFIDFVHPEDRERTAAEAARLADAGCEVVNFINRYLCADGSHRYLEWNVRTLSDERLLYGVARDATERIESEAAVRAARDEAQRANLAKSEFLSRMSHELRTPLNAILGFGQLLQMDELAGRSSESVAQVMQAGRHLLTLIDEVLDISRIEAGTMRMSVEPVDAVSALGDVVALIAPIAAEREVSVLAETGELPSRYVLADRQRLRQVLLNLLSNAVKYNRAGGSVRVALSARAGEVEIAVRDTGEGIEPEKLRRLFVAFDRLGAEHGEVEGTGLGLTLTKSLVQEMGGSVHVESTPGEGSVFSVRLAAAANPLDARRLASARSEGSRARNIGAGLVLHIEDNPANARLVSQALASQLEVRLMLAMQGNTGLELARAHRPDLILLDLHLPDMGGADVLGALQADADTAEIPVVVMSADATPGQVRALRAAGARDYLTKPLDVREFLAVVESYLIKEASRR